MAGTVRIVSENFGATLGSALIYTVGGILLLMFRRPAPILRVPKKYLIIGGLLFVFTNRRYPSRWVWPLPTHPRWK